ncbi:MAG: chloride channel protein [Chloroflexi bacterium]|nr:MAG: chloride channel protein [Chloroflexota bacterium]TME64706.1 MAG: chloride channel protein [Chloroflexota bacterium]
MSDQPKDNSISRADAPVEGAVDQQAKVAISTSGEPETPVKTSYYLLMVYAALFGSGASLLAAAYITLYGQGIKFFEQPSHFGLNIGRFWPLVLLTVGGVLIGLAITFFGQHAGLGVAQAQYAKTGRITPRYVPSILLEAFIALWSGAAVGPEGPLVFLSGGVGSFIADRLKLEKDDVPLLVYSAIAGAFGGFFGSPVVGAVGALEYMFIRELDFYRHLIPGLIAAAFGYGVYFALLHTSFLGIFAFPSYASPRVVDLGFALLVGVIAGVIGILFKVIFGIVHLVFAPLKSRPLVCAIVGGVVIGLIGSFLPLTLYSGQNQLQQLIHNSAANTAAYSVGFLLLLVVVKALLTSTSFATGFDGGPVFPLLFMGGTLGLAISQVLTFIPQGVAVTAGMAGVACAGFPIPLTVALLLGLMGGQPDLLPVIAIGAVTGFLVSKALTPLLPKRAPSAGSGEAGTKAAPAAAGTGEA